MTVRAKRTGLITRKVGMTQTYDELGQVISVTLLKADENYVIGTRTPDKNGYSAVVLGFGEAKQSRATKSLRAVCAKINVKPVKHIKEFRVSPDAVVEAGKKLSVTHFVEGQLIDIQGTNIGKGFAGGMKRHNFRGLEASHGVSITHRSIGSTGQRQDPGKTFKGKKMPGHMGAATVTVQNVTITVIDEELGLIGVNGSVPGKNGSYVYISDAVKVVMPGSVQYPAAIVEGASAPQEKPAADKEVKAPGAEEQAAEPVAEVKEEVSVSAEVAEAPEQTNN